MKFMKLGSKPDQFQTTDGENIRYVATELATDMVVSIGDVKFYVHKFPLLSKSSRLQKLVSSTTSDNNEVDISDIPGGPAAFEICAKFCYGMIATLNAYNVVPTRCAAEYLEMFETVEKGNLIYKIDVFLTSSILKSWKDSIIALQTTKSFLPWSEDSKIVGYCLDSIAGRASTDLSRVEWSYSYDRKKLDCARKQAVVPNDWWVEDLCELQIDLYERVILTIRAKGKIPEQVVCESLMAYALKRVPFFNVRGNGNDLAKYSYIVEKIISLLPTEKENSVPCGFLLRLLQASIIYECGETRRMELTKRVSFRLDEAAVGDLVIRGLDGDVIVCDVDVVRGLVEGFVMGGDENDGFDSKGKVARLVDGYLAEAARDSSLPLSKFIGLAELVSGFPRSSHDGIYRAIDMFLKEHPSLTKSEKKGICRLMDCKKLSPEACSHAVQNERLPLRAVVQVLFFEQARSLPDLPVPGRSLLPRGSYGSSVTTTTTTTTTSDEDWEELKDLKGELASLRLMRTKEGGGDNIEKLNAGKGVMSTKVKKVLSRLWSGKERRGEMSTGSDTSDSPASTSGEMKESVVVVKVNGRGK